MLSVGHAGFVYAPVTKAMVSMVILTTVFGSIISSQSRLTLHYEAVRHSYQLWRVLTHHFVFSTPGELLFGMVLMYYFRQFERHVGSSKFCFNLTIVSLLYTGLLLLVQWLCFRYLIEYQQQHHHHATTVTDIIAIASGPYAFIMMTVVQFIFETPRIYHFQLFKLVHLSDKTLPFLTVVQLLLSNPPASLTSAACAAVAALTYRIVVHALGLDPYLDFPQPLVAFASTSILPWLNTSPPSNAVSSAAARRQRAAARYARVTAAVNELLDTPTIHIPHHASLQQRHQQRRDNNQGGDDGNHHQATDDHHHNTREQQSQYDEQDPNEISPTTIPTSQQQQNATNNSTTTTTTTETPLRMIISADHVNTLAAMGFARNDVIAALHRTHNNVQAATEILLRNSS